MTGSFLSHLECGGCGARREADRLWNLCPDCRKPLLARYDLEAARRSLGRRSMGARSCSLWRYAELLPVRSRSGILTLGEGMTPLVRAARLGGELGLQSLYIKDEGVNPTGSFKARGLSVAVSRASELGVREISIPSAGNAAGAAAAYAALAGIGAHVFMPSRVPPPFVSECEALGASVRLVEGLITDCGRTAAVEAERFGRFDLSTLREPYRLEGKKTMGYEIAEQLGWTLPQVIVYPTGGGTGLVGMWKAFDELEALGWIGSERPRMVCVQPEGCAPMVRAFHEGAEFAEPWEDAGTCADGLCVPSAVGDFLILRVLRRSGGTAVTVSDRSMIEAARRMGRTQGIFACPEGGATLAALDQLIACGWIDARESVVLCNTGSGHKYEHLFRTPDGSSGP